MQLQIFEPPRDKLALWTRLVSMTVPIILLTFWATLMFATGNFLTGCVYTAGVAMFSIWVRQTWRTRPRNLPFMRDHTHEPVPALPSIVRELLQEYMSDLEHMREPNVVAYFARCPEEHHPLLRKMFDLANKREGRGLEQDLMNSHFGE